MALVISGPKARHPDRPPDAELPLVSAIVPGHNAAATLDACLAALSRQSWPRERLELVYVDDGSSDESRVIAGGWVDVVVALDGGPLGPAAARNAGARRSAGEIFLFVDADVVAPPRTVAGLVTPLLAESSLHAVFGSYDAEPRDTSLTSQYRNLMHHYVHQVSPAEAETFWAGCGAMRRDTFERLGGFDSERYRRPSVEDIELGGRLRASGLRIRLAADVQVKHLKTWTLREVVKTDLFARGIPWMQLLLEGGLGRPPLGHLNLRLPAIASVVLAWATLVLAGLAVAGLAQPIAAAAAAVLSVALDARLLLFFARRRGVVFALATAPLLFLFHLLNGLAAVYAAALKIFSRPAGRARRRTVAPAGVASSEVGGHQPPAPTRSDR